MAYDNKTKYKIIQELCAGKTAKDIEREHNISATSAMNWLRKFINNGPFNEENLTPEEYAALENLRDIARKREIEMRIHGVSTSESFDWLLIYDSALIEWKKCAEEWIKTVVRGKSTGLDMLSGFFKKINCTL